MLFSSTSLGGIFRAVRSADKLIKTHCFHLRMNIKTFIALVDISTGRYKATLTSKC